MNWGEIFALSSAAIWALAVIMLRRSGETLPAFELNLFKNVFGFVLMIPTILIFYGLGLPDFSYAEVLLAIASGVLGIALAEHFCVSAIKQFLVGVTVFSFRCLAVSLGCVCHCVACIPVWVVAQYSNLLCGDSAHVHKCRPCITH